MPTKDYTKGMAQLADEVQRYITKYRLATTGSVNGTTWTSTYQLAAAAMLTAATTLTEIPFREQP